MMAQSNASTIAEYLDEVPEKYATAVRALHHTIIQNLPVGYEAGMAYGMVSYFVPHTLFPSGYHVNPSVPLGIMALAAQKNYIALYHLGMYQSPELLHWFVKAYKDTGLKLDMGKSCIRFTNPQAIPTDLIAQLATKLSVDEYIRLYTDSLRINKQRKEA